MKQKQEYDNQFRIIFLGDIYVGKSSMMESFFDEDIRHDYFSTPGVDHRIKFLKVFNKVIRLWMWDSSGDPSLQMLVDPYFRSVDGAFICFDVSDIRSFQNTKRYVERLRAIKADATIMLIGCKADLVRQRIVSYEEAQAMAGELGLSYLEVSALKKTNIKQAMTQLTHEMFFPAQLKKNKPALEEFFNKYLKEDTQTNRSGLFAAFAKSITNEGALKEECRSNLAQLFDAISMDEVLDFCKKTLQIIKKADDLFEHANPFWSKVTPSPLAKALKQTLAVLYSKQLEIFGITNLSELIQQEITSAASLN